MAGVGLPHAAIREQLARGFELVVHLERDGAGRRRAVALAASVEPTAGGVGVGALDAEGGGVSGLSERCR